MGAQGLDTLVQCQALWCCHLTRTILSVYSSSVSSWMSLIPTEWPLKRHIPYVNQIMEPVLISYSIDCVDEILVSEYFCLNNYQSIFFFEFFVLKCLVVVICGPYTNMAMDKQRHRHTQFQAEDAVVSEMAEWEHFTFCFLFIFLEEIIDELYINQSYKLCKQIVQLYSCLGLNNWDKSTKKYLQN